MRGAWGLILLLLVPVSLVAQTDEEKLAVAKDALAPFGEYFVRDGGRWTTPNKQYEPGSDQPHSYGLEFDRKLNGWAITTRIFGIQDGEPEVDFWEIVMGWDAGAQQLVVYQLGNGGAVLRGTGRKNSDGTLEMELHGAQWDGSPFGYRDVFRIEGPDRFEIDAFHPNEDGEMVLTQTNVWTREKESS